MSKADTHRKSIDKIERRATINPDLAQVYALLVIAEILADISERIEAVTDNHAIVSPMEKLDND